MGKALSPNQSEVKQSDVSVDAVLDGVLGTVPRAKHHGAPRDAVLKDDVLGAASGATPQNAQADVDAVLNNVLHTVSVSKHCGAPWDAVPEDERGDAALDNHVLGAALSVPPSNPLRDYSHLWKRRSKKFNSHCKGKQNAS